MREIFYALAFLLFGLIELRQAAAQQWEKIGWEGGKGPDIELQLGNTVYGSANYAYYKSTDWGKSWTYFNNGLPNPNVFHFTTYRGYILSQKYTDSSGQQGFFYAGEHDSKWSFKKLFKIANGKIYFWSGDSLVTFIGDGSGQLDGFYLTQDAGKTWERRMGMVPVPCYFPVSVKNSFFISTSTGTYRTDDFGLTWKTIAAPGNDTAGFSAINMFPLRDSLLIRFYYNGTDTHRTGLYRSSDFGNSWQQINDFAGKYLTDIADIISVGGKTLLTYYLDGTHVNTYHSEDLGLHWQHLAFADTPYQLLNLFGTDNTYILRSADGFFATDSAFSALSPFATGSIGVLANSRALVGVIGTKLFALVDAKKYSSYDSLLVSTDNGSTWTEKLFSPGIKISTLRWVQKGNIFYVLGFLGDTDMCIFKTTDSAATWSIVVHFPSKELPTQFFIDGDTAIGGRSKDFLITIDNARSWTSSTFPQSGSLRMDRRNGVTVTLNSRTGALSYSHDLIHWASDNPFIVSRFDTIDIRYAFGPYIFGERWFRFCQFSPYDSRLLYRTEADASLNNCFGFSNANINNVFSPVCDDNGILFAPYYTALFYSMDSGTSWQRLGDYVPNSNDVFVGSEYIFFTGSEELWRIPKQVLYSSKAPEPQTVSALSISSFPNPASTSTHISYSIPQHSDILLEAFDMMGRSVARIAAGTKNAGTHEAEWDMKSLSSGSYIIRISACGESVVKIVEIAK